MNVTISRKTKLIFLALIILIGAFFRFYQLSTLPPGDGFDPAYYGLDALRILSGDTPIYFATNFGREAIFSYLVAAAYLIVGPGTLGIHLASAVVAVLTIPAVFLAGNEFFKRDKPGVLPQFGGLLAALVLALSFWHLAWSRYSVRAILIPLFISLLCFFLLRALRTQQRRFFALTGLVMGLSLYTYQLGQLFPILVAIGLGADLIARRSFSKKDAGNILLTYGLAVLAAVPLAVYVVNHPGVFNQRIGGVFVLNNTSALPEQVKVLGENMWQVVKMYTVSGDRDPLINIPERPSLNPFLAVALIAGLVVSLVRWRRPQYFFLLAWFGLMSSPAFLAEKAAMSKRALGALPASAILIALALLLPLDWLLRRRAQTGSNQRWPTVVYSLLLLGGLVYTGANTYQDYFITWGTDPGLLTHYNVGVAEIGEYIAGLPDDETVYLSPTWLEHATLKLHARNREGIHAYNGRHCFVYPQETTTATNYIIVPGDEGNSLPLLESYFPKGEVTHEGYLENGDLYYTTYQIPPETAVQFQPQHPLYANWNDELALIGYDISGDTFKPGDTITVNLYFQPLADMAANYTAYLHLLGPVNPETGNPIWGQVDREPCFQSYPTSWWQAGEIIRDTFNVTIAPDAPVGAQRLTTGFYRWPELTRLDVVDSTNEAANQAIILQPIQIEP